MAHLGLVRQIKEGGVHFLARQCGNRQGRDEFGTGPGQNRGDSGTGAAQEADQREGFIGRNATTDDQKDAFVGEHGRAPAGHIWRKVRGWGG